MKICVSGGTGFIGEALLRALEADGHSIVVFTRHGSGKRNTSQSKIRCVVWDGKTPGAWEKEIDGADAVINLAGEPIAGKRWTAAQKLKIRESRTDATRAIVGAIGRAVRKPRVLVNGSAVGYYGPVEEGDVTENHPAGSTFLADVVKEWESCAAKAMPLGVRVVMLRVGVVVGPNGGALTRMILPFRLFVGGPLGSGRQWFPWIHIDDVVGMILYVMKDPAVSGPVNTVAPHTVTMKEFSVALGVALRRPSWAPVPGFALKILLGEMSDMLLTGQKVIPRVMEKSGYVFQYPRLDDALAHSVR